MEDLIYLCSVMLRVPGFLGLSRTTFRELFSENGSYSQLRVNTLSCSGTKHCLVILGDSIND